MIRKRKPGSDDRMIYRLIENELVPLARQSNPSTVFNRKETADRIKRGTVFAAEKGGKVHGFISFFIKKEALWIDMLAVDKNRAGAGSGSALLARAEQSGRQKGCGSINLFLDRYNNKAQQFYENRGYIIQNYIPGINCYVMTKMLESNRDSKAYY